MTRISQVEPTSSDDYKQSASGAQALLFHNGHDQKALRVEISELALEFTDSVYIGTDPEGDFFYNDMNDFDIDKPGHQHTYKVEQVQYKQKFYIVIEWFRDGSTTPYAKFAAVDNKKVATRSQMDGHTPTNSSQCRWTQLKIGSAAATVEKKYNSKTITVDADVVSKKATWSIDDILPDNSGSTVKTSNLVGKDYKVKGVLYYKKLSELKGSKFVNYDDDRIIFYDNDYTGRDFNAYFIPLDIEAQALGTTTAEYFRGVNWIDT